MGTKEKKSINYYMRSLHRDVGFFIIGIVIIYSVSGFLLVFRDTDFLKNEKQVEKQLSPNINESELGATLRMRNFEVSKTEGDTVYFKNGTYSKATGMVKYSEKALPAFVEKLNKLHKPTTKNITHWVTWLFATLLLFLAISSFWMFRPSTKLFRRGLIFAGIGITVAVILFFL